ncbi:alpha/beta hydrolase [Leisingera aquaemixtae]|uniref:Putative esterase of the alpha/beta hydrolase fold protein n=1 Tax=Leisingera aquaemixtae TaxID=1396826 RepID=A0A0P1HCY9_9RHOB|nr:alpha/beta fold hydrolase [Leisingera aquaemixtae]CUI01360.1 putative esterase of the alpha/beta hydrolase fold protein [Leisingera aquaemixtae]
MQRLRLICGVTLVLLTACTDRSFSPTYPAALNVGTPKTVFAATNRDQLPDGTFGVERAEGYSLLELTVSIPPEHTPGSLKFGYRNPDPVTEFTMAGRKKFESDAAFGARLQQELAKFPPKERDITVFVHGFNSTQAETAFRAAQLTHDINVPGATVIYSWPSKGQPLGYAYDGDSVLFARDGLEQLLRKLRVAGAGRVVVVAHSMGGLLTMETLRQIEIQTPGWTARNLGGVVLMSPDLDIDVFKTQMRRFRKVPQPFLIFVSRKDNILTLSQRLRGLDGQERLGNLDNIEELSSLPVEIIDTTAFAGEAESQHFVAASSPALVALLNGARQTADTFARDRARNRLQNILPGQIVIRENAVKVALTGTPADNR